MVDYQNPFQNSGAGGEGDEIRKEAPESAPLMLRVGAFAADIFIVLVLIFTIVNLFILSQNPEGARALEQYSEEVRDLRESHETDEAIEPPPLPEEAERLIRSTYVASLLTLLLYFVVAELLTKGASPGKLLFKIQVIRTDHGGQPVVASATILRSVIKAVAFALAITHPLLLVFLFNYFAAFLTRERRAGHDYIARTKVIAKPLASTHAHAPSQDTAH